ncbi:MAG TPA: SEL1-like repeat protein [Rhodanobacteraceae bacterium]|nr:SEL1-like repeat protein [Rhodanobacteraceae bacterium]
MTSRKGIFIAVICGVAAGMLSLHSFAQSSTTSGVVVAPDYDSGASAGSLSDGDFNTPESDGRPGVKFFTLGVQAFRKGEYRHAIDMYKIAASWAYKPAEYNLAVMYFKGQGVPVDRPLGAAWMVLAAERGDSRYVQARDMMVTLLSKPEFVQTDERWGMLKKTYGDAVALRRAKAQWAWVKTHQTGTRVGGTTGELAVGVLDGGHTPVSLNAGGKPVKTATTGAAILQGGSIDGSIAYRQFQQSDDPYDPVFLKNRHGTVQVEPLTPLKSKENRRPAKGQGDDRIPPPAHPRSA